MIVCPECEALWLDDRFVQPLQQGQYGVTWFDLGSFIKVSARDGHWNSEVIVIETFTR